MGVPHEAEMSRRRVIFSGQGWGEFPESQGGRIVAAVTSPQPDTVISAAGRIRVHRLPKVDAWPDKQRTNVSGRLDVRPIGRVRT